MKNKHFFWLSVKDGPCLLDTNMTVVLEKNFLKIQSPGLAKGRKRSITSDGERRRRRRRTSGASRADEVPSVERPLPSSLVTIMHTIEVPLSSNVVNGASNAILVLLAAPLWAKLLQYGHDKSDTSELLLTGRLALGKSITFCRKRVDLQRTWRKIMLALAMLAFLGVELMLGFVFNGFSASTAIIATGIASVPREPGNYTTREDERPCVKFSNSSEQWEISLPILLADGVQDCESRALLRCPLTEIQESMTPVGRKAANRSADVAIRWQQNNGTDVKIGQFYYGEALSNPDVYQVHCIHFPSQEIGYCHSMYRIERFIYVDYSHLTGMATFTRPRILQMKTSRLKIDSEFADDLLAFYKGMGSTVTATDATLMQLLAVGNAVVSTSLTFISGSGVKQVDNFQSFVNSFFKFDRRKIWIVKEKEKTRISAEWGFATLACFVFSVTSILFVMMCSCHNKGYMRDVSQENAQVMMSLALNTLSYGKYHNKELLNPELMVTSNGDENHLSIVPKTLSSSTSPVDTKKPMNGLKRRPVCFKNSL
jgi:hypothetical protein